MAIPRHEAVVFGIAAPQRARLAHATEEALHREHLETVAVAERLQRERELEETYRRLEQERGNAAD